MKAERLEPDVLSPIVMMMGLRENSGGSDLTPKEAATSMIKRVNDLVDDIMKKLKKPLPPLQEKESSSYFTNLVFNYFSWLAATFRCEYLMNFASVKNAKDLHLSWSDYGSTSRNILNILQTPVQKYLQEIVDKGDKEFKKELREFSRKLFFYFQAISTEKDLKLKKEVIEQFKGNTLPSIDKLEIENLKILHSFIKKLDKTETPTMDDDDDSESETKVEAQMFQELLKDNVFMTELFQAEQSNLWNNHQDVQKVIWIFARLLLLEWSLYCPSQPNRTYLLSIMRQLRRPDFGSRKKLKSLDIFRFFLKNSYSANLVIVKENPATNSMTTTITYGVYEGNGKIWKHGNKFKKFEMELLYETKTDLSFRTIFDQIQVNMGLACNLVEDFINVIVYYDQKYQGLLYMKVKSSQDLETMDSSSTEKDNDNSLLELMTHNSGGYPNYMAITFPKLVGFTDEANTIFAALTTNSSEISNPSVINTLVLRQSCDIDKTIVEFIEAKVMQPYFQSTNIEEVMSNIKFSCNQKPLDAKQIAALNDLHSTLNLNSSKCKTTVTELKAALKKIERPREFPKNENFKAMKIDFLIDISNLVKKTKIHIDQNLELNKLKIYPSIGFHFDRCFKLDVDAKNEIKSLSKLEGDQRGKNGWFFNLNFYLPKFYIIDCKKIKGGLNLFDELVIKDLHQFAKTAIVSDSCKYRLSAFIAEDPDGSDLCIYQVRSMLITTMANHSNVNYHELVKRFLLGSGDSELNADKVQKTPLEELVKGYQKTTLKFLEMFRTNDKTPKIQLLMLNDFQKIFKLRILIYTKIQDF